MHSIPNSIFFKFDEKSLCLGLNAHRVSVSHSPVAIISRQHCIYAECESASMRFGSRIYRERCRFLCDTNIPSEKNPLSISQYHFCFPIRWILWNAIFCERIANLWPLNRQHWMWIHKKYERDACDNKLNWVNKIPKSDNERKLTESSCDIIVIVSLIINSFNVCECSVFIPGIGIRSSKWMKWKRNNRMQFE